MKRASSDAWHRLLMVVALGVSTAGAVYHNLLEFPGMSLGAPEMLAAVLPATILAIGWLVRPGRALWWATLVWVVALNLVVGAILTVLPIPILPFSPEQSWDHYAAHILYALAQLPAVYLLAKRRPVPQRVDAMTATPGQSAESGPRHERPNR
jgi:hypothetical protein